MFTAIRRHFLVTMTLFALVGQTLLSNGFAMINVAHASEDMPAMQMMEQADCHSNNAVDQSHCCDQMQSAAQQQSNCCEGEGFCQGDCNHCLVISVAGTLITIESWPGFVGSQIATATQMPHFHSISLPRNLRPPIA